jgi:pimeloyl-ACP methyl ester carboxylesterase
MKSILTSLTLIALVTISNTGHSKNKVAWSPCYQDLSANQYPGLEYEYQCAQVNVPLDHDQPNGAAIALALVRIPASDPDVYRGSLFLNPGGPGGSGVNFALAFGPIAQFFVGPVATQYDIVGLDPRGVGRSTGLRCFGTTVQAAETFPPVPFPFVAAEVPLVEAAVMLLEHQCSQRGNKVRDHMSTANVAKDLELLRQAVGDEHLNFLGLSYGSYLGQTYANLFPAKVGAFVIDGVLDPIAWANVTAAVPFSVALRSDAGAQATLEEFLRQCDAAAPGHCALAPNAANRLNAVLDRLRDDPLVIVNPFTGETFTYLYSYAVADLLSGLYSPQNYPQIASFFAFLESIPAPLALGAARTELQKSIGFVNKRGFPNYPNGAEAFPGVACEDTTNPDGGLGVWFAAGKAATAAHGIFGEAWAWGSSPCAVWSNFDSDAYKGPFSVETATPVLVIGNFYDPATRYEGALAANALLTNSVLLSVDEPGHTSLGLSGCAGALTGLYLSSPSGYAAIFDGFICPSNGNWFDKLAPSAADTDLETAFRMRTMPEIAFRPW